MFRKELTFNILKSFEMKQQLEYTTILKNYKHDFSEIYGIKSMGIFGSVARDEHHNNSDLDVYIETNTPNPFILVHIKNDLENLFQCHIDLIRYRENMNPFLKERIEKEGIDV